MNTQGDRVDPAGVQLDPSRRLVVAGEFNAGKSSLINLLLRRPVLMPSVGKNRALPIRVIDDATHRSFVIARDSQRTPVVDFSSNEQITHAAAVEIMTPIAEIPRLEVVELPAPGAGSLAKDWVAAAMSADVFVWCTIASQAWRLSEKACIEQLPRDLQARSVLVVTRSDLLRSDADREKISKRLARDAAPFFDTVVFVGAGSGRIAQAQDDAAWRVSGGAELATYVRSVPENVALAPLDAWKNRALKPDKLSMEGGDSGPAIEPALAEKSGETPIDSAISARDHQAEALIDITRLSNVPGFIAACVVETEAAVCASSLGKASFEEICARSSLFLRLQRGALPAVSGGDAVEEIVVSTRKQFQLIRSIGAGQRQHVVLLISRSTGNLAQALIALRATG